jgi:hypothetical protein
MPLPESATPGEVLTAKAWFQRVESATAPAVLYHATTPKKLDRYHATGTILPPIRGFDSEEGCREWGRLHNRAVIVKITPSAAVYPLPDHHLPEGLAWWTTRISAFEVI